MQSRKETDTSPTTNKKATEEERGRRRFGLQRKERASQGRVTDRYSGRRRKERMKT